MQTDGKTLAKSINLVSEKFLLCLNYDCSDISIIVFVCLVFFSQTIYSILNIVDAGLGLFLIIFVVFVKYETWTHDLCARNVQCFVHQQTLLLMYPYLDQYITEIC